MLREINNKKLPHRNIHLIFGARKTEDILYREEMEQLARELPGFRYDVALSRQPDWQGYQGYVHQIYQQYYSNIRPDITFMICGWSQMIDEAVAKLIVEMGYDRSQVRYELYG
jgi:CDP-4-dehydro-6-deoxyglucose reductase